tara:strand:+ start:1943 stop:2896 length:954 start_codon:yes stop_codon:yes gene_type:complete
VNIALVGVGKIAKSQHVPNISMSDAWNLVATVALEGTVEGVDSYTDFDQFLLERKDVEVVSFCVPAIARFEYAVKALKAGLHVMLEKPPGATISEINHLQKLAEACDRTLFTTWHSQMAPGVSPAKEWLADKVIEEATVTWHEDIRQFHVNNAGDDRDRGGHRGVRNQDWIFEPGGIGVFDTGINAISILTEIIPHPLRVTEASLVYPENRGQPIQAELIFDSVVRASFNFRHEGKPIWDMHIVTDQGELRLERSATILRIDGVQYELGPSQEYARLYSRMSELILSGESEVNVDPLIVVADIFMIGTRHGSVPFNF